MYLTTDLYRAAAIILDSGRNFDRIEIQDCFKALIWEDETKIKHTLERLEAGKLLVNIKRFKCVHIGLKKQLSLNKGGPLE